MTHTRSICSRRLVARVAALLFSAVVALTCTRWAAATGDWLGAPPSSQPLPSLDGATAWINSPPLDAKALQGKIVLVDFWTYSCINCLRTLPYVRAWSQKYGPHGLVVIGAHTPEFEFEHSIANVQRAVKDLGIGYPVAVDSRQILWNAFGTRASPTIYFVDAEGRIRNRQLGAMAKHPVLIAAATSTQTEPAASMSTDSTNSSDKPRTGGNTCSRSSSLTRGARAYAFTFG